MRRTFQTPSLLLICHLLQVTCLLKALSYASYADSRTLVTALANTTAATAEVVLHDDVLISSQDFEGFDSPITVRHNLTITGNAGAWRVLDLSFVRGKVRLAGPTPDTAPALTIRNLVVKGFRSGNAQAAPGLDILVPGPTGGRLPVVRLQGVMLWYRYCLPPQHFGDIAQAFQRPPELLGMNLIALVPPLVPPGGGSCSNASDVGPLERCWATSNTVGVDLAMYGYALDVVTGSEVPGEYLLHLVDTRILCERVLADGLADAVLGAAPAPPSPSDATPPLPPPPTLFGDGSSNSSAGGSGGGGSGGLGGADAAGSGGSHRTFNVTGVAAGSSLGGAVLAVIALATVLMLRRRRRRLYEEHGEPAKGEFGQQGFDDSAAACCRAQGKAEAAPGLSCGRGKCGSSDMRGQCQGDLDGVRVGPTGQVAAHGEEAGPVAAARAEQEMPCTQVEDAGRPSASHPEDPVTARTLARPSFQLGVRLQAPGTPELGTPDAAAMCPHDTHTTGLDPSPNTSTSDGLKAAPPALSPSSEVVTLLPGAARCGAGSFGQVLQGTFRGQRVAVKVLADANAWGGPTEALVRSFAAEVEVLGRCRHPNVVRLLAACPTPPSLCLVMELMDTSLDRLLYAPQGGGGAGAGQAALMPLAKVLHIATEIARGLAYLHPTITHRDLKPANVLLNDPAGQRPTVRITDFGLSRLRSTIAATQTPGAGTPGYLAPEAFIAYNKIITHQADIYSFGMLLWEMLGGQPPWRGYDALAIGRAVGLHGRRPPLGHLPPGRCPPRLRSLLEACWEGDPRRRPVAAEVAKVLALAAQELDPPPSAPSGPAAATPPPAACAPPPTPAHAATGPPSRVLLVLDPAGPGAPDPAVGGACDPLQLLTSSQPPTASSRVATDVGGSGYGRHRGLRGGPHAAAAAAADLGGCVAGAAAAVAAGVGAACAGPMVSNWWAGDGRLPPLPALAHAAVAPDPPAPYPAVAGVQKLSCLNVLTVGDDSAGASAAGPMGQGGGCLGGGDGGLALRLRAPGWEAPGTPQPQWQLARKEGRVVFPAERGWDTGAGTCSPAGIVAVSIVDVYDSPAGR